MTIKKLLPFLVLLLGTAGAYAQVGIGTSTPNASSQLEIVSHDKGVLIPQVTLSGTGDTTTITNGNVESLLVYNTATVSDVTPGYYYWHIEKWYRISTNQDSPSQVITTLVDNGDGTYTYTSENGTITVIDIPGNQAVTTLFYNQSTNT